MRKDKDKPRRNLVGLNFKLLTVLEFDSWVIQGKNTRVSYWTCKCECGKLTKVKGTHLTRGDTKSCGCYKPNKLEFGKASMNVIFNSYKRAAKNRNYLWDLSKEQFESITKTNCFYCNKSPNTRFISPRGNGEFVYNGIDRLNNSKGYFIKNCVACCRTCNRMKSNLSVNEFRSHMEKICQTILTIK